MREKESSMMAHYRKFYYKPHPAPHIIVRDRSEAGSVLFELPPSEAAATGQLAGMQFLDRIHGHFLRTSP